MIRSEISELASLGTLANAQETDDEKLTKQGQLLLAIKRPISDEEARILVKLFGIDDSYGLAWTLLHLIETAPGWPITDCLSNLDNEWIVCLRESAVRAGLIN